MHTSADQCVHFVRCAEAHRFISGLLLTHVANAWRVPFPSIKFPPLIDTPSIRLTARTVPVPLLEVAKRFEEHHGRGTSQRMAPYRRSAPYPLMLLPLSRPTPWDGSGQSDSLWEDSGVHYNEYHLDEYAEDCGRQFSLPQLNFESLPIPHASVSADFCNDWTGYHNDSFSGAQRRPCLGRSHTRNARS